MVAGISSICPKNSGQMGSSAIECLRNLLKIERGSPLGDNMKNTTTRNTLAAFMLAGTILATTACGAGSENSNGVSGTSPVSESASAQPTATETPTIKFSDGEPVTGTHGLTVKGPAKNEHGEYLQITIAKDDPALVYNPDLVRPEVATAFSPEEIVEAQKVAMTFAVEEYMDSVINEGYQQIDEWIAANKSKFAPELLAQVKPHADANKHFVHRFAHSPEYNGKVSLAYDKDSTRIVGYGLRATAVRQDPKDISSMVFDAEYGFDAVGKYVDSGEYTRIDVDGTLTIAVRKDENNPGKWLITGIHGNYKGTPLSGPLAAATVPAQ